MAKETKQDFQNKKHMARAERERIQQQYVIITLVLVVVATLGLIIFGIIQEKVLLPNKAVATVNGEKISIKEFENLARYTRMQLINQYAQTQQFAEIFGGDASSQGFVENQLAQIRAQLEPALLGQSVVDQLIEYRLIAAEAERMGVEISDADVEKAIQEAFGYYANGTPTPAPTAAVLATSTLSPLQLSLLPPTPTPTITETLALSATTAATEVLPEPTTDPNATPEPSPTPYTGDAFKTNYTNYLTSISANAGVPEDVFRNVFYYQLLREKVLEAVAANVQREQDQVWARHILVADEATALSIIERLNNGEDFSALATELSTDPSAITNGGDLGWFGLGAMVPEFEQAAFSLDIGETSQPVQSTFGWHVIQVLGHESRPIADSEYEQLRQEALSVWLEEQRKAATVELFEEVWQAHTPTEPALQTSP